WGTCWGGGGGWTRVIGPSTKLPVGTTSSPPEIIGSDTSPVNVSPVWLVLLFRVVARRTRSVLPAGRVKESPAARNRLENSTTARNIVIVFTVRFIRSPSSLSEPMLY